jgi:formylglycine-generating enzyme required for sulfatase activity
MGKVAIVGVEGSGKTVLMAGLCECFKQVPGSDDPYLLPENKAAHMFMMQVPHKLRVKREWPAATNIDGLRSMKWTLRRGQTILEEIEMLDYPGELYRLAFDDDAQSAEIEAKRPELSEFLGHLTDAKVLVVLMNLSDLENPGENAKNAETIWMTRKIFDYAERLTNIERKMLVFTQADRYEEQLESAGGPEALYARDLPMIHVLYPHLMVTAVSAVDQVNDENRPREGYSSQGCAELMDFILNDSTLNMAPGASRKIKLEEGSYLEFVWCPSGTFLMGSPETEKGRSDDEKQHLVTLTKGFFIGKYPVTQQQWELIMGCNPSGNKSGGFLGFGAQTQPNYPVESVSYADCLRYCEALNKRLEVCSVRLPTEAEWEYACRAGTTTAYAGRLEDMAWYLENANNMTHEVGRKRPNPWGIFDMLGNVCEWCLDCYSEKYPLNAVDPYFSKSNTNVLRGGCYFSKKENCRSAVRGKRDMFSVLRWIGFRLVVVLK